MSQLFDKKRKKYIGRYVNFIKGTQLENSEGKKN